MKQPQVIEQRDQREVLRILAHDRFPRNCRRALLAYMSIAIPPFPDHAWEHIDARHLEDMAREAGLTMADLFAALTLLEQAHVIRMESWKHDDDEDPYLFFPVITLETNFDKWDNGEFSPHPLDIDTPF